MVIFLLLIVIALSKRTHRSAWVRILNLERLDVFYFVKFFSFTAQWVARAPKGEFKEARKKFVKWTE